MPYPSEANVVILFGSWFDHLTRAGMDATITATPLPAGSSTGSATPNLVDAASYSWIKSRQWVTKPLASGAYALPLLANDDPDLTAFGGYRIDAQGESPFIVNVSVTAATVTVTQELADAIAQASSFSGGSFSVAVGATVQAVHMTEAAVLSAPAPQPPDAFLNAAQTNSVIATALGTVRQVPDPTGVPAGQVVTRTSSGVAWQPASAASAVSSVAGKTGAVTLAKADVGLASVDNTADTAKPVSTAQQTALDAKASASRVDALGAAIGATRSSEAWSYTAPLVDLPEATGGTGAAGAYTATRTASNLLNVLTRFANTSDLTQPAPPATVGARMAIGREVGASAVTLSGNGSDVFGSGTDTSLSMPVAGEVLYLHCTVAGRWRVAAGFKSQSALDTRHGTVVGAHLLAWAYTQAFRLVSATRDANEAITTASVVWPDGSTGTFTTDTASSSFPGAIDAYHVTYVPSSGATKTVTQSAVTRDTAGAVTAQPALVVA